MKLNNVRWFSKLLDNFKIEQGNEEIPSILPAVRQTLSLDRPHIDFAGGSSTAGTASTIIAARPDQCFYLTHATLRFDTLPATTTSEAYMQVTIQGSTRRVLMLQCEPGRHEAITMNFTYPIKCDINTNVQIAGSVNSGTIIATAFGYFA